MLNYKNIKSSRQWTGSIGLSEGKFHKLLSLFSTQYESINGISLVELSSNLGKTLLLPTYADCLFYVLFQLKNGLGYDALGLLIQTDASNARLNFEKYLRVLDKTLLSMGMMPKREFKDVSEFEAYFKDVEELIFDGSEQSITRPQDNEKQAEEYSAKKRNTRIKN
jgi:hypothetical protein